MNDQYHSSVSGPASINEPRVRKSLSRRALLSVAVTAPAVAVMGRRVYASQASPAPASLITELKPLMIRGVNYYPSETPWSGFWTRTPADVIRSDMELAGSLHVNAIRTFVHFSRQTHSARLTTPEGGVTEAYFAKVDHLLAAGWQNGIRAVLCFSLEETLGIAGIPRWQRLIRQFAGRFRDDGRILLWDLMNEPDGHGWDTATEQYLREAIPFIKSVDANHLTTVGLAWRSDLLAKAGLPDVLQYHEYAPKAELFARGAARVSQSIAMQRQVGGARPVFIGEFGMSTARDSTHGASLEWQDRLPLPPGTEADQEQLYRIVLEAAEQQHIAGVMPWCLHSYPTQQTGFLTPTESMFGLVRHDGTLKPAALLLRDTYQRWSQQVPSP